MHGKFTIAPRVLSDRGQKVRGLSPGGHVILHPICIPLTFPQVQIWKVSFCREGWIYQPHGAGRALSKRSLVGWGPVFTLVLPVLSPAQEPYAQLGWPCYDLWTHDTLSVALQCLYIALQQVTGHPQPYLQLDVHVSQHLTQKWTLIATAWASLPVSPNSQK